MSRLGLVIGQHLRKLVEQRARSRGRFKKLLFETLEERALLATIYWDGGPTGGGTDFRDPANFVGDISPGAGSDVVIETNGPTIQFPSGNIVVSTLLSSRPLRVSAANVSVTNQFQLSSGQSLIVEGIGSWSSGTASVNGATLRARAGGLLRLGGIVEYKSIVGATFEASGNGSVLDLASLQTLTNPATSPSGSDLFLEAFSGGKIDVRNVTRVETEADDKIFKAISVLATGVGSLVDFSKLNTFVHRATHINSKLRVETGGEILAPQLGAQLDRVDITINGSTSKLPYQHFTTITTGAITVDGIGNDRVFTALTDIRGTSLYAVNGATLSIPSASIHAPTRNVVYQALGVGSLLNLSTVTALVNPTTSPHDTNLVLEARSGGKLDLRNVTRVETEASAELFKAISVLATGAGSLVDFSRLNTFVHRATHRNSRLQVEAGGEILAPQLTSQLDRVDVTIIGATSKLPHQHFTSINNCSITVDGVNNVRAFSNLRESANTSYESSNGATLRLPSLISIRSDLGSQIVRQSGSNSRIELPALQKIEIINGNLSFELPEANLATLIINQGTLTIPGTLKLNESLVWSGGVIQGNGSIVLEQAAQGTLSSSITKSMLGRLVNYGSLSDSAQACSSCGQ